MAIENPKPLSNDTTQQGDGYSCGNWTDDLVALANAQALRNFGALFPQSFGGGVYLIGESYAGASGSCARPLF